MTELPTLEAPDESASIADAGTKPGATKRQSRIRTAVRYTAAAITVAVIVALARSLQREGPAALAAWHAAHVQWSWIALACTCGLAGHALFVLGWRRLLIDTNLTMALWDTARVFFASNLGRYIPGGKAWQMSIVGVMASARGLPAAEVAATSLLQGVVGVAVGLIVLLATGSAALGISSAWLPLAAAAGVASLLATPAVLHRSATLRTAIFGRWPNFATITIGTMWALVWTSLVSWIFWGLGLYALARGLISNPGTSVSAYVAAWVGPFIAGLLAIVAPAGAGVRDGAMKAMLDAAGVNPGEVVVVVVVARVWVTVLEVVPALIALASLGYRTSSSTRQKNPGA